MSSRAAQRAARWTRILVSVAALAALALVVDWPELLHLLGAMPISALLAAAFLGIATHTLLGARWHVIARRSLPGTLAFHVAVYWRASIFGLLTPAALGADAYRVLALRTPHASRAGIAGLVMRERFMGLASYLAFALVSLPFVPDPDGALSALTVLIAAALGVLAGVWWGLATGGARLARRVPGRLADIAARIAAGLGGGSARENALALALTLAACITWFALVYALARPLAPQAGPALAAAAAVLAELVRVLPLSIQGVGLRESAFGYAFRAAGESFESGVATGLLGYLLYNVIMGAAGLLAAARAGAQRESD